MSTIINTLTGSRFKRCLAMVLCLCMVLSMAPVPSFAAGSCEHHPVHTAECGYVEAVAGQPCQHQHDASCGYQEAAACGHVCGDGLCGYVPAQACGHYCGDGLCNFQAAVGCNHVCGEAEGCTHYCGDGTCSYQEGRGCDHVHGGCGYQEGHGCDHVCSTACGYREYVPCAHVVHDASCGYVEAVQGHDCNFVCEICNGTVVNNDPVVTEPVVTEPVVTDPVVTDPVVTDPVATDPVVTDPVVTEPSIPESSEPEETNPVCSCETKCDPEHATESCAVCKADSSKCEGAEIETQPETQPVACIHGKTEDCSLCRVQELINQLPDTDSVNEENEAAVRQQLAEAGAALAELSEGEAALLGTEAYWKLVQYFRQLDAKQKEISSWQWIDEWDCIDPETNELIISFASAENPASFDDVVELLPYEIDAVVEEEAVTLELGQWRCEGYPEEGTYEGSYLFQASLPEGYVLGADVAALEISVIFKDDASLLVHTHNYVNGFCDEAGCESPYMEAEKVDGYYQIGNAGQLFWFAAQVNESAQGGINGALTAEIQMPSDRQWTPIGQIGQTTYSGIFDGNENTIRGLNVNDTNRAHAGLFGYMNGTIRNVTLAEALIIGRECVGGICGTSSGGTIENCHFNGTVSASSNRAGAICGKNSYGTILKCTASGSVTVKDFAGFAGGICGELLSDGTDGKIIDCVNNSTVTSKGSYVGGICGESYGLISGCANYGTVEASSTRAGGICGAQTNSGSVKNCLNRGSVSASNYAGGICGSLGSNATIERCCNVGSVNGSGYALCGASNGSINNCLRLGNGTNEVSEETFLSGWPCWRLNSGANPNVWGQKIGVDTYPSLGGPAVYQVTYTCGGTNKISYTNEGTGDRTVTEHSFDESGLCSVCNAQAAAAVRVGEETTYYTSFDDAFTAANAAADSTVTLLADVTVAIANTLICTVTGDVILDLNGHTMENTKYAGILVEEGATLTIQDSSEEKNGAIKASSNSTAVNNQGTLVITGGYLEGSICVYNNGSLTIEGGRLKTVGPDGYCVYNWNNPAVTITGGTFEFELEYSSSYDFLGPVDVSGGTFLNGVRARDNNFNDVLPNDLLDIERAYFDENSVVDGSAAITGNVTVGAHPDHTAVSYRPNGNIHISICGCGRAWGEKHVTFDDDHTVCPCGYTWYWDGNEKQYATCTILTQERLNSMGDDINLAGGWYVVRDNVSVNSLLRISYTVNLILADGCQLSCNSGISSLSAALTIWGQSQDSKAGELTSTGDTYGMNGSATINGGSVKVYGRDGRAFTYTGSPTLGSNLRVNTGTDLDNLTVEKYYPFGENTFTESAAVWIRPCSDHNYSGYSWNGEKHSGTCRLCGNVAEAPHKFDDTTGFCQDCDAYEPAPESAGTYQISNAGQLFWFAKHVNENHGVGDAELTTEITIPDGKTWTPIGTGWDNAYKGTFDGKGKTISGLYFDNINTDDVGLFGFVAGGTIKNVTVEGYFSGESNVGGICGYLMDGSISGCVNKANVSAYCGYVGGICGELDGMGYASISGCRNEGPVSTIDSGASESGGICGLLRNNAWIQSCSNSAWVTCGDSALGGIAGGTVNWYGTLTDCWNSGDVGMGGNNSGVGGIVGQQQSDSGTVSNCYHKGLISANSDYGPICGSSVGTIENCFYLSGGEADSFDGTTFKTEEQFKSGEVAYLLQAGREATVWGQILSGDNRQSYPVLFGQRVYQHKHCPVFSNDSEDSQTDHTPGANGCCTVCGAALAASVTTGGATKVYVDFQEAFNQANTNGGTLTLLNSVTTTQTLTVTGTFKLDLNGFTLTANSVQDAITLNSDGTLTILDSSRAGTGAIRVDSGSSPNPPRSVLISNGTLDFQSGTLYRTIRNEGRSGTLKISGNAKVFETNQSAAVENFSHMEISGGYLEAGICVWNSSDVDVTISGGEFKALSGGTEGSFCVVNGSFYSVKITGGTFERSNNGYTFSYRYPDYDSISVTSATFTNGVSVWDNGNYKEAAPITVLAEGYAFYLEDGGNLLNGGAEITEAAFVQTHDHGFVYTSIGDTMHNAACDCGKVVDEDHKFEGSYKGFCENCGAYEPAELVGDSYEISNAGQLFWFAALVNDEGYRNAGANGHLKDGCTITLSSLPGETSWIPIAKYSGTFDGKGGTIEMKVANRCGFIDSLQGGTVQNLTVAGSILNTEDQKDQGYAAGICAVMEGDSSIINCHNKAEVRGWGLFVGGICCTIRGGQISRCTNTGSITTTDSMGMVGGIAGAAGNDSRIEGCGNSGTITSRGGFAGGIAGVAEWGSPSIEDCWNKGTITASNGCAGGIFGGISKDGSVKSILNCYNVGTVSGSVYGPILGDPNSTSPSNCYYQGTGEADGYDGTTFKTEKQFASGEVAYLLQAGRENKVWGQEIGTDPNPVLGGEWVYQHEHCPAFSNTSADTQKDHTPGANGYCADCGVALVASVTTGGATKVYVDFQEAFNQANTNGGTLTLLSDVTVTTPDTWICDVTGKFILDLNGHTMEHTKSSGIRVNEDAELTIQDSSEGQTGTIKVPGNSTAVQNLGTLNITGGHLEGMNAVFNYGGQASISGGHFKALSENNSSGYCISGFGGSVTVTGGTFELSGDFAYDFFDAIPQVSGGTFVNGVKVKGGTPNSVLADGCAFYENKENGDVLNGSAAINVDAIVKEHAHDLSYTYVDGYENHLVSCPCGYSDEEVHVSFDECSVCPCGYTWYSVGENKTFKNCTILTKDYLDGCNYTLLGGWYVVQGEVVITETITTTGDVYLILADGCEFITSKPIQAGVLSIFSQSKYNESDKTGKLTVNVQDENVTAISGTELVIYGGVVQTTSDGTGIGSLSARDNYDPVRIAIYDGYVSTNSTSGAGIGGGVNSHADKVEVEILGGTVEARATNNAAIGACMGSYGELTLDFVEGTVYASSENQPAIGRSDFSGSGDVTIKFYATNNGEPCFINVTAIGGNGAFSHNPNLGGNFEATVANNKDELNTADPLTYPFKQGIFVANEAAWIRPCSDHEMGSVTRLDDNYHQRTCKWCGYQEKDQHHFDTATGFCETCDAYAYAVQDAEGYYQIYNAGQLFWFANYVNGNNGSGNGKLMNDIQIPEKDGKPRQWMPIGGESSAYLGTFDGQGHTISGLYYNDSEADYVGLFGYVDGGTIKNVTVAGSFGGKQYVGGICGHLESGTISGCVNQANVTAAYQCAGGICGQLSNSATIQSCSNSGTVTCQVYYSGGIAGSGTASWTGVLSDCWNSGNIGNNKANGVGGIVGAQSSSFGTVKNCYSYGTVNVDYGNGPICSSISIGKVENCFYLGDSEEDSFDGTTFKTATQFASGEVAYLLQGERPETVWGQTLRGDNSQSYPVLGGNRVYQSNQCPVYYNDGEALQDYHTPGEDGCCTICGAALAASVTVGNETKGYVNFSDAFNIANSEGGTLTLIRDVTENNSLKATGSFTLDLNGKTLTLKGGLDVRTAADAPGLTVKGTGNSLLKMEKNLDVTTGKLTLESGKVALTPTVSPFVVHLTVFTEGTLVVSGADVTAGNEYCFINNQGGSVIISGGSVTGYGGSSAIYQDSGTVSIEGGVFRGNADASKAFKIKSSIRQRITITGGSFPGGLAAEYAYPPAPCLKDLLGKNDSGEIAYWYMKDAEAEGSPITAEEAAGSSLIANLTVLPHTSHEYGDDGLCYCGRRAPVASQIIDNASNVSTFYFETLEEALAMVGDLNDEQRMTITIRDNLVISDDSLTIPEKVNVYFEENASLTVGTLYLDGTIDAAAINKVHATTIYGRLRLKDCTLISGEHIENQDGTYYIQSGVTFTLKPNLDDGEMFIRWILSDTAPNPVNNTFTMLPYPAVIGVEKAPIVATVTVDGQTSPYPSLIAAFDAAYNREAVIELKKDDVLEQGNSIHITSKITLQGNGTVTCKLPNATDSTIFRVYQGGEFIVKGDGVTLNTYVNVQDGTCTVDGANLSYLGVFKGSATVIQGKVDVLVVTKNEEMGNNGTATLSGGTFKVISVTGMTVADLLEDGYAYYVEEYKTWVDANNGDNSDYLSPDTGSIIVKKVPVSFTTQPTATTTMTYGVPNKLTVVATSGVPVWYEGDTQVGTGSELNLSTFNAGEHSFCCKVTVDGYTAVSQTAKVTINARELTVQWQDAPLTYNGKEQCPEATAGNLVNGDSVTLTVTGAKTNAGNDYTAQVTGFTAGEGTLKANYVLPTQSQAKETKFSIYPKALTIASAVAQNRAYNGTQVVDVTEVRLDCIVGEDAVAVNLNGVSGKLTGKDVGNYTQLTLVTETDGLRLTGADASNYELVQPQGAVSCDTVTISPKTITITGITAQGKTYDGTKAATITSVSFEGTIDGDELRVEGFQGEFASAKAGEGIVVSVTGMTLAGSSKDNYQLPAYSAMPATTANIARATLTVNVAIADKQYDGLNTASFAEEPTLVGLVEADKDKVQLTNGTPTFASEKVSEEPIAINFTDFSISGDASGNYVLTQPTDITARIYNSFEPKENEAFTSNSNDANENGWLNQDLVITAKDGYQLSTSNTAEGPWSDKLTVSNDGKDTLEFYVRNTKTGAISQVVEKDYQIDKTQPNGVDITIGNQDASNKDAQLYLNDDVAVKITGKDATSGVAQVYHFLTTEELTDEQVEANTLWVPNANFKVEGADATSYRIYIKVVDEAGNVAYFQSSRFDFDKTDPEITGVYNGKTYYTTQTVTVKETNLQSLTLNGDPVTLSSNSDFQLVGDVDKETTYEIEATDKAGRSTTVTVTMKPLSSLTQDILSEDGEILNGDTVTKKDQSKLESAKEALEKLKGTGTEEEQDKISDMLESIDGALKALDNVKAVEDEINGIKTPVEPDDGDKEQQIIDARKNYENLTPHEKELVDENALKRLEALEKALVDYKFVGGNGGSWSMGSGVDFTLQANGPLKKLTGVKLDDVLLDASDYTATNNRTTITLGAALLQNLTLGEHKIQLVYGDYESEVGSFEVKQSESYLDLTGNPDFEDQTKVFIDGVSYPIEEIGGKRYVNLPETGDLITTFTYSAGDEQDSYSNYPTSMTVHLINRAPDGTTVTNIPEFANLLQYSGCSIRITGNRGIRMITSISESKKQALLGSGLAGFKLVEYGTVVSWKEELGEDELNLDTGKHNYAFKFGVADPVFNQIGGLTQYTNVLVGFDLAECSKDIVMRPYITLQDADGNLHTLYGGCVTRSISYIAWQNQNTYAPGTPAYDYVHELMALYKAA